MTPVRQPIEGPFARSVREALESVASNEVADEILEGALAAAGRATVPEEASRFVPFYEGPLAAEVLLRVGAPALEIVHERLSHMLRMATSQVMSRARASAPPPPSPHPPAPHPPAPSPHPASAVLPSPPPDELWAEDSAIRTVTPHAPAIVLVLTLDPLLAADAAAMIGGAEVATISSIHELLGRIAGVRARIAIVVDTALPSIDVPTVASLGSSIPAGTKVILWGMSERQKERLVKVFPIARDWIASGAATSLAALL